MKRKKQDAVDRELEELVRGMRAARRKRFIAHCIGMAAAVPTAAVAGLLLFQVFHDQPKIPVMCFLVPFIVGGVVHYGIQRSLSPKEDPELSS